MIYRSLFEVEFALSLLLDEDKVATLRTLNDLRESERTHATLLLFSIFVIIDGNTFWPIARVPSKLLTKRFISHWYPRISEFQFHSNRIFTCNRTLQLRYNNLPFFLELWHQSRSNQKEETCCKICKRSSRFIFVRYGVKKSSNKPAAGRIIISPCRSAQLRSFFIAFSQTYCARARSSIGKRYTRFTPHLPLVRLIKLN